MASAASARRGVPAAIPEVRSLTALGDPHFGRAGTGVETAERQPLRRLTRIWSASADSRWWMNAQSISGSKVGDALVRWSSRKQVRPRLILWGRDGYRRGISRRT